MVDVSSDKETDRKRSQSIPPEWIEKLRSTVNIVDIVSEHVVLRKAGSNYVGLCPFHSERSPSFSVSETKQLYHCYGCKAGGDLIGFVRQMHGLGFRETLEELAERGKVPLPKGWDPVDEGESQAAKIKREKTALAYKLNRFSLHFYTKQLETKGQVAKSYLRSRGFTDAWLAPFFPGLAVENWDNLTKFLVEKKAPLEVAADLGLIRASPKDRQVPGSVGYFDLFRNRILFPLIDTRGKVCGFGGRAQGDDTPKYLNSSDSPVFQKSKLLFGIYQAAKHIREANEAILVEGYFDVVAMHAAGFTNTVATCGTALSLEHIEILSRFCEKIIILFDPDEAGQSATIRSMELALAKGRILYSVSLPSDEDPDEFLIDEKTQTLKPLAVEELQARVKQSQPILDQEIDKACQEALSGPEAKTGAIKKIAKWLKGFADPIGQKIRLQAAAEKLRVDADLILPSSEIAGARGGPSGGQKANQAQGGFAGNFQGNQQRSSNYGQGSGQGAPQGFGQNSFQNRAQNQGNSHSQGQGQGQGQARPRPVANKPGQAKPARPISRRDRLFLRWLLRAGSLAGPDQPATPQKALEVLAKSNTMDWVKATLGDDWAKLIPDEVTISDMVGYIPVRSVLDAWTAECQQNAIIFENFWKNKGSEFDPQLAKIIIETSFLETPNEAADEDKRVVGVGMKRALEQISQRLIKRISEAEAFRNADLEANLKKEYLDVQRRLKEFNNFYDEIE